MKKYIKYSLSLMLGIASLSSCDVMDTKPFETYSEDLVWSSKETADAFVMQTYNGTVSLFAGGSTGWESRTPNGALCDQVAGSIDGFATELGLSSGTNMGFGKFGEQRNCNLILTKVAESTTLSDDQKKELTAEAHFLRGITWFHMTRNMGRFVPITKVLTQESKEDFKTPLTSSIEESYQLVMDEINSAIEGLPEKSASGKVNKYAALAFKSRIGLQAYAYTKNDKYLDDVITSSKEIINSGNYELTDNYGGLFNEESPEDNEIILARYYLDKDATVGSFSEMIHAMPNLPIDDVINGSADGKNSFSTTTKIFDGWASHFPTQDLVDQYLVIDEADGKAKAWYETSQYLNNVNPIDANTLAKGSLEVFNRHDGEIRNMPSAQDFLSDRTQNDPLFMRVGKVKDNSPKNITEIMYNNRDKRMDATIIRDQGTIFGETIDLNIGGNASAGVRSKEDGGWYTTSTGYYWKKNTVTPDPRVYYSIKINFHYVIARLGEVYMNLAEAYLLKNDIPNALNAMNATRVRHGGLPGSTASSSATAWEDYIRERRVEMAYENGDIYYSYLRWGKYGNDANYGAQPGGVIKDLNRPVYKINISSDRSTFCINQLTLLNSWNRNFTERRYLFPIPQGAIDTRTADGIIDKQNEGW